MTEKPELKVLPKQSPEQSESAPLLVKPDDDAIAEELAPALRNTLAFFHSEWKRYENGCWHRRDDYELRRYIRKELRELRNRKSHWSIAVNQGRIKALASMLEDDLFIADRVILAKANEQRNYINLRNGLFNLETMQFEPEHRSELYFTTQLDFDYDEDADCPTFRRYLNSSLVLPNSNRTDHTLVTLAKEIFGYCLTARTDMKASFWLVGGKDTGKSTFIALIKALMGDLHTTIDLTQLGTNRFLLSSIIGKRVVTFTEASGSDMLPDALYKALTGGSDEIYADVKNRDPIVFRPESKIVWAMNDMPRVSDRSGATTRRINIVPFNRTIPEKDRIPNLEQLLIRERSGIFNELVIHLQRLQNAGSFEYCKQSVDRLQEYIMENDTEATFIEECAEVHENYRVAGGELYSRYSEWCLTNGFKPKNVRQVARDWRRLGFEQIRSDGSWWQGFRLLPNI